MTEKNNKVPIAILSCFLIAFILQGVLKLSGILVFEKALDWEIFSIIDKYKWATIIYNSVIVMIAVYCLSFTFMSKPFSNKWFHYFIIVFIPLGVVSLRTLCTLTNQQHLLLDILVYMVVPFIVNITSNKKDKLFDNNAFGIISTLSINIILYFYYLGLGYWSGVLTSLLPINPMWLLSSAMFLIKLEVYIGLFAFMLSSNISFNYIKRRNNMYLPVDIATDEAKVKELQEKKAKKNSKKNEK